MKKNNYFNIVLIVAAIHGSSHTMLRLSTTITHAATAQAVKLAQYLPTQTPSMATSQFIEKFHIQLSEEQINTLMQDITQDSRQPYATFNASVSGMFKSTQPMLMPLSYSKDPHKILGVSTAATEDEIKKAHKALVKQHHPDLGGNPENFRKIQESYEVLIKQLIQTTNLLRNFDEFNKSKLESILAFHKLPSFTDFLTKALPSATLIPTVLENYSATTEQLIIDYFTIINSFRSKNSKIDPYKTFRSNTEEEELLDAEIQTKTILYKLYPQHKKAINKIFKNAIETYIINEYINELNNSQASFSGNPVCFNIHTGIRIKNFYNSKDGKQLFHIAMAIRTAINASMGFIAYKLLKRVYKKTLKQEFAEPVSRKEKEIEAYIQSRPEYISQTISSTENIQPSISQPEYNTDDLMPD